MIAPSDAESTQFYGNGVNALMASGVVIADAPRPLASDPGGDDDPDDGDDEDGNPPEPIDEDPTTTAPRHGPFTGRHTHSHSVMGEQGGDRTHTHSHAHTREGSHAHSHGAALELPERTGRTVHNLGETARRAADADNEITECDRLTALVAEHLVRRLSDGGLTAATNAAGDVVGAAWHAYLCVEGVRTDDGRELVQGACRFPDLPVTLRLLLEDDGGHWGAVTCGRIDSMERQTIDGYDYIYAEGVFGSDPNGQLAEVMVTEQTQRFVSIDPRDVTAEYVEIETRIGSDMLDPYDDCDSGCTYDAWLRMTDLVIGAATIVAMPALPQAVITLAEIPLPQSPIALTNAPLGVTASAAPISPPSEWFENPGFYVGDPRLVRQTDPKRSYACPLTVSEDGRVFGHLAYWNATHTALPGQHPPRSRSGYAHFLTGACPCDDPACSHAVGQITMGCGHAPMTKQTGAGRPVPLSPHEVLAHYDGGYGAVQMADVTVGEDDFGIWFAGALKPGRTAEEIRDFRAMGVSGDWRKLAGALDLLAALSVPVPGFPIARRALVASGAPEPDTSTRAAVQDGEVFALVASGVVRPIDPAERLATLEREIVVLSDLMRPIIVERQRASLGLSAP